MSKKGRFDKDALPINPQMYKKGTFGGRGGEGAGGEGRGRGWEEGSVSLSLSHTPPKTFSFDFFAENEKNDIARSFSLHYLFMAVFRLQSIHFLCLAKMWVNTAHFWYIKNKKVRCWIIIYLKTKHHLLNSVHLTTTSIATLPLQPIRSFRRVRIECSHVLLSKIYYHK